MYCAGRIFVTKPLIDYGGYRTVSTSVIDCVISLDTVPRYTNAADVALVLIVRSRNKQHNDGACPQNSGEPPQATAWLLGATFFHALEFVAESDSRIFFSACCKVVRTPRYLPIRVLPDGFNPNRAKRYLSASSHVPSSRGFMCQHLPSHGGSLTAGYRAQHCMSTDAAMYPKQHRLGDECSYLSSSMQTVSPPKCTLGSQFGGAKFFIHRLSSPPPFSLAP